MNMLTVRTLSAIRKARCFLVQHPLTRNATLKMVKRRAVAAGLPGEVYNHSFRGTGITKYLCNAGTLEMAIRIAGHESIRTNHRYNRVHEQLSLNEIERIHIQRGSACTHHSASKTFAASQI